MRLITGMKARVFYPSISCDGTVGVFTVGTAEGCMLKKRHLGYYRDDCVFKVCGASHAWPEEEIENKKKCLKQNCKRSCFFFTYLHIFIYISFK